MLSHPDDLKYTKTHEFVKVNGHTAKIGITAFAADQLGDVTYVELPKVGVKLKKGDKFGVIESVKSVSDLYMPISGEITGVNDKLDSEPELVNTDCYTKGWMLEVTIANLAELDDALTAQAYQEYVAD
jgi:glycine cleavage system H protein